MRSHVKTFFPRLLRTDNCTCSHMRLLTHRWISWTSVKKGPWISNLLVKNIWWYPDWLIIQYFVTNDTFQYYFWMLNLRFRVYVHTWEFFFCKVTTKNTFYNNELNRVLIIKCEIYLPLINKNEPSVYVSK